ncbi:MAG: helix-turn-helix domain-containing protein [Rhodoferax sp.]
MVENYYTTRDAARLLGVSVRTVQQWIEKGYLQGWKTKGGHRRIRRSSVSQLLTQRGQSSAGRSLQDALTVVVVEDSEVLQKLYRSQIAHWAVPVTLYTALNGYEALVMVGKVAPDLLICDLRLPGVTGFQVVRALCEMERYQQLRIVVVSGMPAVEIEAHGSLPARVEIIGKPIDFTRLQQIAHCVWSARRASPCSTAGHQAPENLP